MISSSISETKHVLLENLSIKWVWREFEIKRFIQMWIENKHIQLIADELGTNKRSITLLVMDQAEQGNIMPRKQGLWGE